MTLIRNIVNDTDNATGDAFSRLRVSTPEYVFDTNFQYDAQPLIWEQIVSGSGASVAHNSTNRDVVCTFSSTPTGGKAELRTTEHFRYQAGRSQLIFMTFVMGAGVSNVTKFVGYSDGNNGIEFQLSGTTKQFVLYSDTDKGDETVAQNVWNLDKLDGSGPSGGNPSGITLDLTKPQIMVVDLQWLGVGRVRVGFDIDGVVVYVHQFLHANRLTAGVAYMQTANLPLRWGMSCTGTVSATMRLICASVISEGGESDIGGYLFAQEGTVTAGNGARTHILSVRPKALFNSIANRSKFILESVDLVVTGSNSVSWELCLGQAISGTTTFNDVNTTYSASEYNIAGTISGSPAIVIAQGYAAASASIKTSISKQVGSKYPITLDAAGVARALGTLTVVVTGIGGASATRAVLNWREIR